MKKQLLCIGITVIFGRLAAQNLFTDFSALQFGDSILVEWTLKAGNTCFEMRLERAASGDVFETIYSVPGLCGASEDLFYSYFDADVISSGTYAYRVTGSGGLYISDTITLQYVRLENDMLLLYPNPADHYVSLYIDKQLSLPITLQIFAPSGQMLHTSLLNTHQYMFDAAAFGTGFYLVIITSDSGISAIRNLVLH